MFYPELEGDALKAYVETRNRLVSKASKELLGRAWFPGQPIPDELVVRTLRPEDLGLANPEYRFFDTVAGATAAAFNTVVNVTVADNRFIGIYALVNNEASGEANEIRATREGTVTRFWPLQQIQFWQSNTGFADDPFTADQNTNLTIDLYLRTASTVIDLHPLGLVVEKKGLLVNP